MHSLVGISCHRYRDRYRNRHRFAVAFSIPIPTSISIFPTKEEVSSYAFFDFYASAILCALRSEISGLAHPRHHPQTESQKRSGRHRRAQQRVHLVDETHMDDRLLGYVETHPEQCAHHHSLAYTYAAHPP